MLFLRRPTVEAIRAFLAAQARLDLTYAAVGATATKPPAGYVVDHTRIRLGVGEKVFATAKAALERWQQFRLGWLEASPDDTPIKEGQVVAILARSIGLWWLNACRIVAVIDEDGPVNRFGFAYGTLPDHAGSGEECQATIVFPFQRQLGFPSRRHRSVSPATIRFPDAVALTQRSERRRRRHRRPHLCSSSSVADARPCFSFFACSAR
jgi:uncharacterized protein (UPF0548 family)